MNSESNPHATAASARRRFLKNLAVLGGAMSLAPTAALACGVDRFPARLAKKYQWFAEGPTDLKDVVGYIWPFPPEGLPLGDEMELRVRLQFPHKGRDVASFMVFVSDKDAPLGEAVPEVLMISAGLQLIDQIEIGPVVQGKPELGVPTMWTLAMLGSVIENEPDSPFGPIVGRKMALAGGFDHFGVGTTFYLLGAASAGSHATYVHEAAGYLHVRGCRL